MKRYMLILIAALLLSSCVTACAGKDDAVGSKAANAGNVVHLRTQGDARVFEADGLKQNGRLWIPADRAAALLNYRYAVNPKSRTAAMGFGDPLYTLSMNSASAKIGDDVVQLREAPRMVGHTLYLEVGSLSQLLQTPVRWDKASNTIVVSPRPGGEPTKNTTMDIRGNTMRAESVDSDNGKAREAIAFAKTLLSTPYAFNAEPYAQSHAFDSSSFMQYVFGHVGVALPRTAKSQSTVGANVSRNNLMPGDLVFFYTPGRFGSNDAVGNVGLYLGGNKIIQTYGNPGVTITALEGDWDKRFMWARRVL
ncbi:C40 family peptidase [Paenibacillus glycinis]|uniref:NlpC/P60 domain-containing protein n=1 Tax=Paenibacillus glycinis TaxID=2697035 RepID=A0ABW9XJM4_9BACL|nr:NlpC/P60 family protein [Paenibacillus glycinis]NBD22746.1 hypothetical protein [Paenibacillus glycinis]